MRFRLVLLSLVLTLPALALTREGQAQKLVDDYLAAYFAASPTAATQAGVHDYDDKLEDLSARGIKARLAALRKARKPLFKIPLAKLTPPMAIDLELTRAHLDATLLDLEEVRSWEKNPDVYGSLVNQSVYALVSRKFAPAEERMKLVIAREKLAPAVLAAGKANLKGVPRVYADVALEQLPGMISFFESDVPLALAEVKAPALVEEFKRVNAATVAALKDWEKWLKEVCLPKANGDFRLGKARFLRKLALEEMVELPLERLEAIGLADLRANQAAFRATAQRLDPKKSEAEILADLKKDHPPAEKLLDTVRAATQELKRFLLDHSIVTLPSSIDPIVQETPPFERALFFASMDSPGPFETKATEAYYNVTPPEKTWPPERIEEHLMGYGYGTIVSTSIHEAYPGHYTQLLWLPKVGSRARKIFGANSNIEGWAHYTEQMLLDEGYGKADPKLRLGQLQDALLRNARYLVAIGLHAGTMTLDEAVQFFVKEGYTSKANGERETKRGTSDPTYLYYTLGKLEILKLREDYKQAKGDRFSLKEFHDAFLAQGFPPIRLARRALLGKDGPVL